MHEDVVERGRRRKADRNEIAFPDAGENRLCLD